MHKRFPVLYPGISPALKNCGNPQSALGMTAFAAAVGDTELVFIEKPFRVVRKDPS
jgi:hypothetical protein